MPLKDQLTNMCTDFQVSNIYRGLQSGRKLLTFFSLRFLRSQSVTNCSAQAYSVVPNKRGGGRLLIFDILGKKFEDKYREIQSFFRENSDVIQ